MLPNIFAVPYLPTYLPRTHSFTFSSIEEYTEVYIQYTKTFPGGSGLARDESRAWGKCHTIIMLLDVY